jgi:non-heme chloroperoxidase
MERISIRLDGIVTLSALKAGEGNPLIMIPGWSQSSEEWKGSAESLSAVRKVIALDMRGHGESEKPEYGYRVYRLAQDLHETLNKLNFPTVDLMAHSMGCAVIWAYIDLYGQDRIGRLVLVDQAPCMFPRAEWTPEEVAQFGCFYKSADDVDELAATAFGDWRDVIQRIQRPTLVIGGEASIFTSDSQRWIASQIPDAQVVIFAANEGGSHFMFVENPDRFDSIVLSFLSS